MTAYLNLIRGEADIVKQFRINEGIRAREVRLIGEASEQLGIVPLSQALQLAREHNIDLVEVAPTAVPPVCRLLDYGKFKYEQEKKERQARKTQKQLLLREIRLRPKTDEHDIDVKTRLAKKLLDEGNKVKVSVVFRGRELSHPQLAKTLLDKISQTLQGAANLERPPAMEGRFMSIILSPSTIKTSKIPKEKESPVAKVKDT